MERTYLVNRIEKFKQLRGPTLYGAEQALPAECWMSLPPGELYGRRKYLALDIVFPLVQIDHVMFLSSTCSIIFYF